MSQVYDEPIVVRLIVPVGPYPVGSEFGFDDLADAVRALGSSSYFTVVRTQDGDPIPPPTPEDMTEAEKQALARARAARLIRGADFDPLVPGPGEVIVGGADGPVARDVSEIGGGIKPEDGVFGVGVRRIIASTNPNYPLEDGDLLVLIDAETYFTDFSEYATGAAPHDWVAPWATTATWSIREDAEATGGKVLRANSPEVARNVLAWTKAGEVTDAEVVWRWRANNAGSGSIRVVTRIRGGEGSETGVVAGAKTHTLDNVIAGTYNAGAFLETTPETVSNRLNNTWYRSRARVSGSTVQYREWADGDDEPSTWTLTRTIASPLDAGMIGLHVPGFSISDIDWVGIGYDGDTAPMGG